MASNAIALVTTLAGTTGELFKAIGRPVDLLRTAVPHLVLLAIAIPIGARHGLVGVACTIAIVRIAMAAVALRIARGHLALPMRALADATAPAIAATVFMTAALAAAAALPAGSPVLGLAMRIGVGGAAYGIGHLALRHRRRPASPVAPRAILS